MPRGFFALPSSSLAPYTHLYWERPFPDHRQRYLHALRDYDAVRGSLPNDEWRALLLVLTSSQYLWERAQRHLNYRRGEADGEAILKYALSRTEALLLKLALHLYGYPTSPEDLAHLLSLADEPTWLLAMAAIERRRGAGNLIEMRFLA